MASEDTSQQSSGQSDRPPWESWLQNGALVVVILVMIWLAFNVRLPDLEELQAQISSFGWAAIVIFIGAYALVALTPIPVTIMAVAGGLLFGGILGSILSIIGAMLGCWGAYWIARGLGRSTVLKLLGSRAESIQRHLDGAGFEAVFTLRLMPGFPYWPVNYGAGVFGISQRVFVTASGLALIPGQVSLAAIGGFIATPDFLHGALVVVAWIVVIVLTIVALRRWKKERDAHRRQEETS